MKFAIPHINKVSSFTWTELEQGSGVFSSPQAPKQEVLDALKAEKETLQSSQTEARETVSFDDVSLAFDRNWHNATFISLELEDAMGGEKTSLEKELASLSAEIQNLDTIRDWMDGSPVATVIMNGIRDFLKR